MKKKLALFFLTMALTAVGLVSIDHRAAAGSQERLGSADVAGGRLTQLAKREGASRISGNSDKPGGIRGNTSRAPQSVLKSWTDLKRGDPLLLTDMDVFTLYFPIIFIPPPPNPKKGLGVTRPPACLDVMTLEASWYFNWGPFPDRTCGGEQNDLFVPRIYNTAGMDFLADAVINAQESGWLIGFSEPNLPWQGNMSPREGAILWRQIEQTALPRGVKLVSPSPNQWDPGQNGQPYGHQWVWVMVDEYRALYGHNPHFDAMGWNIYKRTAKEIQIYLTARRNEALARGYDVPIWVLEYGGRCVRGSVPEIQETMRTITPWFDATPWIGRYAWYANRVTRDPSGVDYSKCSLIDPRSGTVTGPGQIYSDF